jgi:hypothetical protein
MISAFILAAVIDTALVSAAVKKINAYCAVLGCPRPVVVSVWPDDRMRGRMADTKRIENGGGCSIRLRREALYRIDALAHEACHCAGRAGEEAAVRCSQRLLEQLQAANP